MNDRSIFMKCLVFNWGLVQVRSESIICSKYHCYHLFILSTKEKLHRNNHFVFIASYFH